MIDDWAAALCNVGNVLCLLGVHRRGPRTLEQAVVVMRNAMAERTPDKSAYGWAVTQNNLAVALQALGTHEEDIQSLEESIPIYDATLKALPKDDVPMMWAMVTANRAAALHALAQESDYVDMAMKAESEFDDIAKLFANVELTHYQQLAEERRDQSKGLVKQLQV
jgi:tetratricopeptide (TPR) repeat protein